MTNPLTSLSAAATTCARLSVAESSTTCQLHYPSKHWIFIQFQITGLISKDSQQIWQKTVVLYTWYFFLLYFFFCCRSRICTLFWSLLLVLSLPWCVLLCVPQHFNIIHANMTNTLTKLLQQLVPWSVSPSLPQAFLLHYLGKHWISIQLYM